MSSINTIERLLEVHKQQVLFASLSHWGPESSVSLVIFDVIFGESDDINEIIEGAHFLTEASLVVGNAFEGDDLVVDVLEEAQLIKFCQGREDVDGPDASDGGVFSGFFGEAKDSPSF